jgi:glycerol kinase
MPSTSGRIAHLHQSLERNVGTKHLPLLRHLCRNSGAIAVTGGTGSVCLRTVGRWATRTARPLLRSLVVKAKEPPCDQDGSFACTVTVVGSVKQPFRITESRQLGL